MSSEHCEHGQVYLGFIYYKIIKHISRHSLLEQNYFKLEMNV